MLQKYLTARLIAEGKRIERIVPAPGSNPAWGNGTVQQRYFPLFRAAQRLHPNWHWRVAYLRSATQDFRLMAQMRFDKPNYKAWLIVRTSAGWAMVARLESHSHAALHCHVECGGAGLTVGEIAPSGAITFPPWRHFHRRAHGLKSQREWWETACKFFRIESASSGSLL
jgi:hypothetical protein